MHNKLFSATSHGQTSRSSHRRSYKAAIPILAACAVLMLVIGCKTTALVTESKISFNPVTGQAILSLPKDFSGSFMDVKQSIVLTNGMTNTFSIILSNFFFRNNPMVLDAQANRDIQMISAMGSAFQNGVQAGAAGAAKSVVPVP